MPGGAAGAREAAVEDTAFCGSAGSACNPAQEPPALDGVPAIVLMALYF